MAPTPRSDIEYQIAWAERRGYPIRQNGKVLECQLGGRWHSLIDLWTIDPVPVCPSCRVKLRPDTTQPHICLSCQMKERFPLLVAQRSVEQVSISPFETRDADDQDWETPF